MGTIKTFLSRRSGGKRANFSDVISYMYLILGVIIIGFLVVGGLYAYFTPPWQTPDEPAHYNYVAQVATGGCCPVITAGDWDADALEALKADHFPEDADLTAIEYEDHQPPAYYLIASLIYRFTDGSLFALRMLSVTFGMGVVLAAYFIVARLLPRHKALAGRRPSHLFHTHIPLLDNLCKMDDVRCRIQDGRYRKQDAGGKIRNSKSPSKIERTHFTGQAKS